MKPIDFKESNCVWAKDQKPYRPLPAFMDEGESISCWRPSIWERLKIIFTGRIWVRQLNFAKPLQPILLTVDYPFTIAPPEEQPL